MAAIAIFALPAQAKPEISFFEVKSGNTQAGAHPDITTIFKLDHPGEPEVAKTIETKWPEGVFGNPEAVPRCSSIDFALNQCPSFTQIGWVGVRGYWEGNPLHVFGAAPLYDMEPTATETGRFAFTVPGVNIPINIPIKVRTESDYGLNLERHRDHAGTPAGGSDHRSLGLPRSREQRPVPLPRGLAWRTVWLSRGSWSRFQGQLKNAPIWRPGIHRACSCDR